MMRTSNYNRIMEQQGDYVVTVDNDMNVKTVDNREFTHYVEQHWDELATFASKLPHVDKTLVGDLIQDVWMTLDKREKSGNGFDDMYVNRDNNIVEVGDTVKNIVSQYAKNRKYQKHYNNKVNEGISVFSYSEALCSDNDTDCCKVATAVYKEASLAKSADLGGSIVDRMVHNEEVRNAMAYAFLATEDKGVSIESVVANMEEFLNPIKKAMNAGNYVIYNELIGTMHKGLFKEYDTNDNGVKFKGNEKDTALIESCRTIFTEYHENKDNFFNIFMEVKEALANG